MAKAATDNMQTRMIKSISATCAEARWFASTDCRFSLLSKVLHFRDTPQ